MSAVTVRGESSERVRPDTIEINFEVEALNPEYAKAMKQCSVNSERLKAEISAVLSAGGGGKEVVSSGYTVQAEYDEGERANSVKNYIVRQKLRLDLEMDMKKLGEVLDAVAASKAKPIQNIRYKLADTSPYKDKLLQEAVKQTRRSAITMAVAAGIRLGAVREIRYEGGQRLLYSPTALNVPLLRSAMAAIPVEPEEIELHESVIIVWEIA